MSFKTTAAARQKEIKTSMAVVATSTRCPVDEALVGGGAVLVRRLGIYGCNDCVILRVVTVLISLRP